MNARELAQAIRHIADELAGGGDRDDAVDALHDLAEELDPGSGALLEVYMLEEEPMTMTRDELRHDLYELVILAEKHETSVAAGLARNADALNADIHDKTADIVAAYHSQGACIASLETKLAESRQRVTEVEVMLRETYTACVMTADWIDSLAYYWPGNKQPGIDQLRAIADRALTVLKRTAEYDDGDDDDDAAA